jgi:hypothetical protein
VRALSNHDDDNDMAAATALFHFTFSFQHLLSARKKDASIYESIAQLFIF